MAGGKRHDHPAELLAFLRKSQTSKYVRDTAEWIKQEYPGSADELIPQVREIYKSVRDAEASRAAAALRS